MADLLDGRYAKAKKVLLVCDNLTIGAKFGCEFITAFR
jgi:hypothetical protein